MSFRRAVIESIAVLAGAVVGTLIAGLLAWLFASVPFSTALFSPGGYVLALVTVTIYAVLYAKLPPTPAVLASLLVGTLLPAVVARSAFALALSWPALMALTLVFAVVALSAYRFVHANATVREAAERAADR